MEEFNEYYKVIPIPFEIRENEKKRRDYSLARLEDVEVVKCIRSRKDIMIFMVKDK